MAGGPIEVDVDLGVDPRPDSASRRDGAGVFGTRIVWSDGTIVENGLKKGPRAVVSDAGRLLDMKPEV